MLSQLTIQNFALLEQASIEFESGFNVLTGETGAGKSVLIDAISAALGARGGSETVRAGAERAMVEAVFTVDPLAPRALAEWCEDGMIILGREISAGGRSVFRINGRMATAAAVREVAAELIDLHGQHEHQSLLAADRHVEFLDAWAGPELLTARRAAHETLTSWREARARIESLRRDAREIARRADLYRFQIEEIDAGALCPGEEETLEAERLILANAEKLHAGSATALTSLTGSPEAGSGEPCAADLLASAAVELGAIAAFDTRLQPIVEAVESAVVAAQEAGRELRHYHDDVEFNPERLQQVMERIELLRRLRRKYGDTVEEILSFRDQVAGQLDGIERAEGEEQRLSAREAALAQELAGLSATIGKQRRAAAARFDRLVTEDLRELGMDGTRFETRVEPGDAGAADRGLAALLGRVEFLISPNPGEPLRPLAKIASGGEISRVMLALKSVMAATSPVPTLIFDEIDVGVGGRTAEVLGRKLGALAQSNQVLCVTHLPQIACMAATHFRVRKETARHRTLVEVRRLDEGSRVAELARMLGGAEATATRHAEQLLAEAGAALAGVG